MRQRYGQPSSRVLALVVAVGNLLVCGGVTALVLVARGDDVPSAAGTLLPTATSDPAEPTPDPTPDPTPSSTWNYPTTTDVPAPNAGFRQVSGPGGMTTYIPATWPTKTAPGPGAMQADDPTGMARILRFGGSATTVSDSYAVHADYERQFSANKSNYLSIRLDRTDVRGTSAIDWEFEYDTDGGRRHVRSIYWLSSGYEFFVYASAPVDVWPDAQQILDVMINYSTP
jgi:hypothetical protein